MEPVDIGTIMYLIAVIFAARPVAGHIAWAEKYNHHDHPTVGDWVLGWGAGIALGMIWPVVIVGYIAHKATGKIMPAVGAERKELDKQREKEKQEEIRQLRERDRNLGLDPYDYGRLTKG